jgi:glycosyltransferase involved in cell wall biosynthesis
VLAEGMAAGLDVLASQSGAIPEVLGGQGTLFAPGDWPALARLLEAGALARPAGQRVEYPAELVRRYSTAAMADRLAAAYERVLRR